MENSILIFIISDSFKAFKSSPCSCISEDFRHDILIYAVAELFQTSSYLIRSKGGDHSTEGPSELMATRELAVFITGNMGT